MKIGYGYNRPDKDFASWDCDRVFIDTQRTHREERRALFLALHPGDTLFMLRKGDLGHGVELSQLRKILDEGGITVEYPPKPVDGRGRPARFNPSEEDDAYIRLMWKDQTFSQGYVMRVASERTGGEVKRHQLIHRYGRRAK